MPKISYPFAAVPNQVIRGKVGLLNLGVLNCLLSHGKTTCSAKTIASELGCGRTSVFEGLKFWKEHGKKFGIYLKTKERKGFTTVYEIDIHNMYTPVRITDTPVRHANTPRSPREHEEEPIKNIYKEYSNKKFNLGKSPYIEGDKAYQKNQTWYVITHSGEHKPYIGSLENISWV